jgi:hypothetical protein
MGVLFFSTGQYIFGCREVNERFSHREPGLLFPRQSQAADFIGTANGLRSHRPLGCGDP